MTPLIAMLNIWQAQPFAWGELDCVLAPADWVMRWRGIDPAADLRLTYSSAGECQRVTRFFTDPLGVVGPRMAGAGLGETSVPARGDVGILMLPTDRGPRPHGGVCLSPTQWATKAEFGVTVFRPLSILSAWSLGYDDTA